MHFLGVDWVGVNPQNGRKLLLSIAFIAGVLGASALIRGLIGLLLRRTDHAGTQTRFWMRQAVSLFSAVVLILGLLSIWFSDPTRLATAFGLLSAGLAFALQQVVTSVAGYFVILRGSTFTVGDRISMGGVRGDVMRLGFIQTTIMEMGQPPSVQGADPAVWVRSRQFTGRIVTVSNSKIFSEPVFNYTRDFPFIWEEMAIWITYKADRARAEQILLDAAHRHAIDPNGIATREKDDMQGRFGVNPIDLDPRVFVRMTDNWIELSVRFIVDTHGVRGTKDAMSRDIIEALEQAGIGIASATYDIVGLPPIEIRQSPPSEAPDQTKKNASPNTI
ncbi:mechanosensitive ion channel family protein [Lichenicola cladoniae]|uniref:Mechanosensitive ion channel family protein n=1 Tax=Lichenicola cladoniae TaxID=1484109 RepID=A0A6M8HLQ4_9PROT|nr:mechanosensitive ion channel domain-containing protein [Lichenicola cladoniae]NPD70218.1 mechanosensitive ion channel family protein [Acetobacteraceae bacterium]QKE89256.1 mechanosensitive ion channel family protein [Lichenicola cladoniae]